MIAAGDPRSMSAMEKLKEKAGIAPDGLSDIWQVRACVGTRVPPSVLRAFSTRSTAPALLHVHNVLHADPTLRRRHIARALRHASTTLLCVPFLGPRDPVRRAH